MTDHQNKMALHFVGIGGIGMSGIAEVFFNQGHRVSGSDLAETDTVRRLREKGIPVRIGHKRENVGDARVVVISSAVRKDNPEILEARERRIPVIPRAEMLGELMRGKVGVAVAGSHGKTTTTSMLEAVLTAAGLDPTVVIGGIVHSMKSNAKLGQGKYVVVEADESDGSFLHLPATYSIITNIDNDHLDHFGSIDQLDQAFLDFVGKLPFYGVAAVCGEDAGVKRCLSRWTKPVVTYGFSSQWDYVAEDVKVQPSSSIFKVVRNRGKEEKEILGEIRLGLPGRHNVLNALAVVAISCQMGVPFDVIARGLGNASGVKRRFELIWKDEKSRRQIVDDYGHHPTEIAATLAVARNYWTERVITIFQPHRYTRTLHCREGFRSAFRDSDVILITDIYAAGEEPIEGVSAEALVGELQTSALPNQMIEYVGDLDHAVARLTEIFKAGDLLLCMGAGSITRLPSRLLEKIRT